MAIVDQAFKSLSHGVSQQEGPLRLPNYLKTQVNMVPDPVAGLVTRNGTFLRTRLLTSAAATTLDWDDHNPHVHFIDRDATERYAVIIGQGGIKVYDIADGSLKTVATPDGVGYLAGTSFAVETINDYTFIVNKGVTVAKASTLSPAVNTSSVVWIKDGSYTTTYSVGLSTATPASFAYASYTTPDSSVGGGAGSVQSDIAFHLQAAMVAAFGGGWTFTQVNGSILVQRAAAAAYSLTANDGRGNDEIIGAKDQVSSEGDLPPSSYEGHVLKIIGDPGQNKDDYYVKFVANNTGSGTFDKGYWSECPQPAIKIELDPATMPHVLVREADGTFTFREADWGPRVVGDDETSPFPSFTDRAITAITAHAGRLWLASGNHVVGSRSGDVFHFFRQTVQATLDDDPIDVDVVSTSVVSIEGMLPWNKDLVCLSRGRQFLLRGGDIMTPDNASTRVLSTFDCRPSGGAAPAGDDRLFCAFEQSPSYLGMVDFAAPLFDSEKPLVATPVSDHIPAYITGSPLGCSTTTEATTLILRTDTDLTTVYGYRWKMERGERAQTAWFTLNFPGRQVLGCRFYASRLYIVSRSTSTAEIYLEYLDVGAGVVYGSLDYVPLLDHMTAFIAANGVLQSGTTYRITVPYTVPTGKTLMAINSATGAIIAKIGQGTTYIDLTGPLPANLVVGLVADWRFDISPIYWRRPSAAGGVEVVPTQRLQVLRGTLLASRSGEFTANVKVSPKDAPVVTTRSLTFNPRPAAGTLSPKTGALAFGVNGQNTESEIWFTGSGPHPVRAASFRWLGDLALIAQPG